MPGACFAESWQTPETIFNLENKTMSFELNSLTYVTLGNLNNRVEKHGDDSVPAIDLTISYDAPNSILETFQPGMLDSFYRKAEAGDEGQEPIEGLEVSEKPLLRFSQMAPIKLGTELVGYKFAIDYGIDEDTAIVLDTCMVKKFTLDLMEGGSVGVKFQVQTNTGLTERILGKLAILIGQEVQVTLIKPEAAQKNIDDADSVDDLVLPGLDGEPEKALSAEDVFIAGAVPGEEAAAVH
jgi:hypothetical protein